MNRIHRKFCERSSKLDFKESLEDRIKRRQDIAKQKGRVMKTCRRFTILTKHGFNRVNNEEMSQIVSVEKILKRFLLAVSSNTVADIYQRLLPIAAT